MYRPKAFVFAAVLAATAGTAQGDLLSEREIILSPERGRVVANIGGFVGSESVRMNEADVDISVGRLPRDREARIDIGVHAVFRMENTSSDTLAVAVAFPVSDSSWSAFEFDFFEVVTDGRPRSVFERVGAYPNRIGHRHVSGPDPLAHGGLPDLAAGAGRAVNRIFGTSRIGTEKFRNLMVWTETFAPGQSRTIDVRYAIAVPSRVSQWKRIEVTTSIKGPHPDEANNLPAAFIDGLPETDYYYFFDYYLTTGASWRGPIGRETITLELDPSWRGHKLYFSRDDAAGAVKKSTGESDLQHRWVLTDAEPAANLYFALKRP